MWGALNRSDNTRGYLSYQSNVWTDALTTRSINLIQSMSVVGKDIHLTTSLSLFRPQGGMLGLVQHSYTEPLQQMVTSTAPSSAVWPNSSAPYNPLAGTMCSPQSDPLQQPPGYCECCVYGGERRSGLICWVEVKHWLLPGNHYFMSSLCVLFWSSILVGSFSHLPPSLPPCPPSRPTSTFTPLPKLPSKMLIFFLSLHHIYFRFFT